MKKSSGSKNESFQDYIKKFLNEEWLENDQDESSERAFVGFQTGFSFIMLVLKEMGQMNNGSLLINSLQHLYNILRDINKGALIHKADKRMNMALDVHLNEARNFLIDLIAANEDSKKKVTLVHPSILDNQENAKRIVLLAHKILLLIGIGRSSVEDLLILCSIL
jgi:hypothetical protein